MTARKDRAWLWLVLAIPAVGVVMATVTLIVALTHADRELTTTVKPLDKTSHVRPVDP